VARVPRAAWTGSETPALVATEETIQKGLGICRGLFAWARSQQSRPEGRPSADLSIAVCGGMLSLRYPL